MKVGLVSTRVDTETTILTARACERSGLDSIWLVEDLWHRGSLPLATACALTTDRIRIGIGVLNPYNQHPSLIAMNYGALAEFAAGRAVLGIGSSVQRWVEQMGLEYRLPRTATKEAIEIVRELLAGGPSSYQGKAFQLDQLELGFESNYPTPLYMGAMGERTVRTCGEVADGWLVSILEPVGYLREAMGWLREGAEKAGRDVAELEVVQYLPFACSHDSAAARAEAKEVIGIFIVGELELYRKQDAVMSALSSHLDTVSSEEYMQALDQLVAGVPPREAITDALCDELAIAGTPAECAALLRRYRDAGVTEAALLPAGGGAEAATVIAEEVVPLLGDSQD